MCSGRYGTTFEAITTVVTMARRHTREEILEGALALALEEGLGQLTFGRVASRLGISDRMVVYYLPSKDDLVGEVLGALATRLMERLAPAFATPSADHLQLARRAWPLLAHPDADPVFALFFEANGSAAVGREPYRSIVGELVEGWVAWAATLVEGRPQRRRAEAEAAIALLDGLLLLRGVAGPEAADRAARRLGVA